jgi:hypothetical protein
MKALLICPADRPGVVRLADHSPLALAPLLGKSVLEYWLEALAARGAKHVVVLASDRPDQVRTAVGDGRRWGLQVDLIPQARELSVAEARKKFRPLDETGWLATDDIMVLDNLPGQSGRSMWESYADYFAAVQAWLPHALGPARIGAREIQPGVWVGMHSQVDPTARLIAPCWIGDNALIAEGATIGPNAFIDDRVVVETGARVEQSVVWPETFVGRLVAVRNSVANGSLLLNWVTGSCLQVPDAFLLGPLGGRRFHRTRTSLVGRAAALGAMTVTAPLAVVMMGVAILRGETPLRVRLGVRAQSSLRHRTHETFAYYELTGGGNWLRRWPQFWSVFCGDLTWVGNRPLRPSQAFALTNDFERLWLAAPTGLVSLADAYGCTEGVHPDACAHASFYAVNQNRRLDATVIGRAFARAAMAWPIYWHRRREAGAALPELISKQES